MSIPAGQIPDTHVRPRSASMHEVPAGVAQQAEQPSCKRLAEPGLTCSVAREFCEIGTHSASSSDALAQITLGSRGSVVSVGVSLRVPDEDGAADRSDGRGGFDAGDVDRVGTGREPVDAGCGGWPGGAGDDDAARLVGDRYAGRGSMVIGKVDPDGYGLADED